MKSLMMLWQVAAAECGSLCGVSTALDLKTIQSRVEHEGISFLTITLPRFCKDFERSLADEFVAPDAFLGFTRRAGLPQFLGGFLELVFDRGTGRLIDAPSIEAIYSIRQLTLLYGKVEIPCSPKRVRKALRGFVNCESEVKEHTEKRTVEQAVRFRSVSALLWSDVLQTVENDLYADQGWAGWSSDHPKPAFIPRHGPGATADRVSGNRKFDFVEYSERLERVFPSRDYLIPNEGHYDALDRVDIREPGTERPVRVITVPKTLETPRSIAIEPSYMQYMQQGLKNMIVDAIQKDFLMGSIVGFDDQHVNRELARQGSLTGSLATLDLSEASDRVSNQLVWLMLNRWPLVEEAVDATRSRSADVPGEGIIPLTKFASMGSALTFPMEAMVFATVVFMGIESVLNRRLTRSDVMLLRHQVRVYGDDIIVPVEYTQAVVDSLEAFGFKVNRRKSFWTGLFRESCGREYYAGEDVSIVRVRTLVRKGQGYDFPSQRRDVRELESFVALRNKFYLAGLWQTARWLDGKINALLKGYYPTITAFEQGPWEDPAPRAHVLGRWTVLPFRANTSECVKTDTALQSLKVKGWIVSDTLPPSVASEVGALLKVLAPRDLPFEDVKHLERSGRPDAVRIKLRWTQPQ